MRASPSKAALAAALLARRRLPFLRRSRAGHGDDADQGFQAREVLRVRGEQRQLLGYCGRRDHQIDYSPPWLAAGGDDSRGYTAVDAGCLCVERHGVELALGPLQDLQPPGALGVRVVAVLLIAAADLMRTGREFCQRDGADRHLGRVRFPLVA